MDMWICGYIDICIYIYIYSVNQGFHVSKGAHIRIYMKNCIYGYMISFHCLPCIQGFKFIWGVLRMHIWIYRYMEISNRRRSPWRCGRCAVRGSRIWPWRCRWCLWVWRTRPPSPGTCGRCPSSPVPDLMWKLCWRRRLSPWGTSWWRCGPSWCWCQT